jgi:hypothetical protein
METQIEIDENNFTARVRELHHQVARQIEMGERRIHCDVCFLSQSRWVWLNVNEEGDDPHIQAYCAMCLYFHYRDQTIRRIACIEDPVQFRLRLIDCFAAARHAKNEQFRLIWEGFVL